MHSINIIKINVPLLLLLCQSACFSMQTTIEMLPDERIEDIVKYVGKNNIEDCSAVAGVNKRWNAITNGFYLTKKYFDGIEYDQHSKPKLFTAGAKHYHAVNTQLENAIENDEYENIAALLQDPYINVNHIYKLNSNFFLYMRDGISLGANQVSVVSPLTRACQKCDQTSISLLLDAKANININTVFPPILTVVGANPKTYSYATKTKCIELLLKKNANIHYSSDLDELNVGNALNIAANALDFALIPFLLTFNINPNTTGWWIKNTPLITLISNHAGNMRKKRLLQIENMHNENLSALKVVIQSLIDANADIYATNNYHESALTYIEEVHPEIAKIINSAQK
ncbi:MAG TPA: hypothetical protein VGW78_03515 [Candidatus Babeliales bacterium]|jgi:hypothetical protein|nr:hypothetical protein [Candidatus Babeliales bacterium]